MLYNLVLLHQGKYLVMNLDAHNDITLLHIPKSLNLKLFKLFLSIVISHFTEEPIMKRNAPSSKKVILKSPVCQLVACL